MNRAGPGSELMGEGGMAVKTSMYGFEATSLHEAATKSHAIARGRNKNPAALTSRDLPATSAPTTAALDRARCRCCEHNGCSGSSEQHTLRR